MREGASGEREREGGGGGQTVDHIVAYHHLYSNFFQIMQSDYLDNIFQNISSLSYIISYKYCYYNIILVNACTGI